MTLKLAVSSCAFRGTKIEQVIKVASEEKIAIEFSSGMPFRKDMARIYLEAPIVRLPHNYFPAPEKPFVLNLASLNDAIAKKSIDHCLMGLNLAAASEAPFFSVHAGFCMDPQPSELGHKFNDVTTHHRDTHWNMFIASIRKLLPEAKKLGVKLYIENNVCTRENVQQDGTSPLLCSDSDEIIKLINEIDSISLGILVDTGHLKVSAATFGFSKTEFISKIRSNIGAFHHSENDGFVDSNLPLGESYWFLPLMDKFKNCYHILEVCDQSIDQIHRQLELLHKNCNF